MIKEHKHHKKTKKNETKATCIVAGYSSEEFCLRKTKEGQKQSYKTRSPPHPHLAFIRLLWWSQGLKRYVENDEEEKGQGSTIHINHDKLTAPLLTCINDCKPVFISLYTAAWHDTPTSSPSNLTQTRDHYSPALSPLHSEDFSRPFSLLHPTIPLTVNLSTRL